MEVRSHMKRSLMYGVVAAVVAAGFLISPASAQTVSRETTCTKRVGSNTLTHDCNINVKNYTLGSPVTFGVYWSCTGSCGTVTDFGFKGNGFTPAGVSGHMIGGAFLDNGLSLTFAFDQLKTTGNGGTGNAHFTFGVQVDDGSGTMVSVPCDVNVHLQQ